MSKRTALVQITQLSPEEEHSDQEEESNISDSSQIAKRVITKPSRPSARLARTNTNGPSKPFSFSFAAQTQQPTMPQSSNPGPVHDRELHMRGLNVSFYRHVQNLLEKTPSVDLRRAFETYSKHLEGILKQSEPVQQTNTMTPMSFSFSSATVPPISAAPPISSVPTFSVAPAAPAPAPTAEPQKPSMPLFSLPTNSPFSFGSNTSWTAPSFGNTGFGFQPTEQPKQEEGDEDGDGDAGEEVVEQQKVIIDPYVQGPGEEDEKVLFAQRCKLYCMQTEAKKWVDLGLCSLRINEHKENRKRRLLAKSQDSTSKVLCNFFISSQLRPELMQEKNSVKFLGVNSAGKPAAYLLRVKNAEQAREVHDQLTRAASQ